MARTGGRRLLRGLAFAGVAGAGYVFGITSDSVSAQPVPGGLPPGGAVRPGATPPAPARQQPDKRIVGYIYGDTPVYREELGEFLIARGGHEKLELLINKKIIEIEAARRGITVTPVEIRAGLEEDLRGLGITLKDFEKHVLPRYHKSLFEWVEDVIKPKLLLTKMCRDRVKVSDEDIQKAYENKYGERRQAKVICWNKEDTKAALRQWDEARKSDADFDRIARQQAEPALASAGGLVAPIGRHSEAKSDIVERTLWSLKVGEMSQLFDTEQGIMCVKLHAIVPADAKVPPDDKIKTALRNEMFNKRLEQEIPKYFKELQEQAKPNVFLKGPPSAAEFREGVDQIINNANLNPGVAPAGGVAPAVPMGGVPKK
jgi:hypothetical protein